MSTLVQNKTSLTDSVKAYYDKLFQDGFLVSVHVSKWGMSTHLNKEDIEYDKAVPAIFKLGKKMLIDPERFNEFSRIEGKARRFLSANSYDFPIGEAHFVPKKKVKEVLTTLDKIRQEFNKLKEKFIEHYDTYKEDILAKYPELADSLRPLYPQKTELNGRFNFSVSLYEIRMPKELGEVDIQSLITRDEAKQEVKDEMEKELADYYKTSMTKLERFTEDAAKVLRAQMVTMCTSVIEKITNKEVVTKTNIQMIRDEIDNFRKLNFTDDQVVAEEIEKLAEVVSGNVNYKTDKDALAELNNALTNVLDKANNLSDLSAISDTYFRAIKL
jgi:hypothetical protein